LDKVLGLNARLEKIPATIPFVEYFCFYEKLVYNTGNRMDSFFDDHVHINAKGYAIFADALVEVLQK